MSVAEFIDPDVFTVAGVFTAAECSVLIERAESIGFDAASVRTHSGPKMMTNIRNNDRVNLDDPELADLMWSQIRPSIRRFLHHVGRPTWFLRKVPSGSPSSFGDVRWHW